MRPWELIARSAIMETGEESALFATYWATERSISPSCPRSFEVAGHCEVSPAWCICSTWSSLLPRCTPCSIRKRKREAMGCPSSSIQPVSIRPASASARTTAIPAEARKARTWGHNCPGPILTRAQLSSPRDWIRTASWVAVALRGDGRGTSNSPPSPLPMATSGTG